MIDAILFDYDDTLVRTRQCRFAAVKALARRWYEVELAESRIERFWGMEYRAFFREVFAEIDHDVARLTARYESLDREFPIELHPDALPALQGLRRSHCLGIVTAVGRTLLERQLRDLGLSKTWFSVLQAAEDTAVHKPDPDVFLPSLAKLRALGIPPQKVTYVGDSLNDCRAATGAGMGFIAIDRGSVEPKEFRQRALRIISSLEEIV
jgi:phosphoglycolate phosphatase-like HAD superfamily hydrolase